MLRQFYNYIDEVESRPIYISVSIIINIINRN